MIFVKTKTKLINLDSVDTVSPYDDNEKKTYLIRFVLKENGPVFEAFSSKSERDDLYNKMLRELKLEGKLIEA